MILHLRVPAVLKLMHHACSTGVGCSINYCKEQLSRVDDPGKSIGGIGGHRSSTTVPSVAVTVFAVATGGPPVGNGGHRWAIGGDRWATDGL